VHLVGRLGRDAEFKITKTGKGVCNASIATKYKDFTEWHKVVAWEAMADALKTYKKGQQIELFGRLATRSWEKDGAKQYTTEVVVTRMGGEHEQHANGTDADEPWA
jgi:single-strand DNA-binding protein